LPIALPVACCLKNSIFAAAFIFVCSKIEKLTSKGKKEIPINKFNPL
jgi:hypothetical protein